MGFTTMDEPWEILNSSFGEAKEAEAVESGELGKEAEISLNTYVIRIYRSQPYLVVAVLEEVGVEKKKDHNNCVFSMGVLGGHRKVPIQWLQGDSCVPLEPFFRLPNRSFKNQLIFHPYQTNQNLKEERNMSKSKIVGMMALIAFAMGILLVGNAVAGEYVKGRTVTHNTKWQQIDVGDEDGHVVFVQENKGVSTNLEGKWFCNGWSYRDTGLSDTNLKTMLGSGHGYGDYTDRDGNKWYFTWEGKGVKGEKFVVWGGTWKAVKGTGKFEGIQGKGTWQFYPVGDQAYHDWEGEVELPR